MQVISAPRVVADGVPLGPACVAVEDGVVVGVTPGGTYAGAPADLVLPSGVLVPGLVDIQINGAYGVDLVTAEPAEWAHVAHCLPRTGVTSFVPTFITAPVPDLVADLAGLGVRVHAVEPGRISLEERLLGILREEAR